ncbi:phosphotransferase [Mycobacterium sp. 852002-51057_SCH5723018]|uniref:phosphotransferase n=1 Tax=Mycobacterium sp. 852002-51057_SCH5723018 TaxID=1834094 RepID=UPI0007FBE27E|nr:phosphotransferase [Mycobacterium sp. 852002-51057_SCH5723018]OBG28736.1 hypothetical protein A5764_24330 [Mycobacterium sp. 852002-51057_SCH5723018]
MNIDASPVALSVEGAADYLLGHGFIDAAAILDGGLSITAVARRNRNLIVQGGDRRGFVLKQPEPAAPAGNRNSIAVEARFYLGLRDNKHGDLASLVPRCIAFDPDSALLVIEYLHEHQTLAARFGYIEPEHLPIALWRRVGAAVAAVHESSYPAAGHHDDEQRSAPAAFGAHQPPPIWLQTATSAALTLLGAVQSSVAICEGITASAQRWRDDAFIHGDMRLDNILYAPEDLRLIDWELCQRGDSTWDVASVIADLIVLWLHGAHPHGAARVEPTLDTGSWSVYQAAIRSLWYGYSASREGGRRPPTDKLAGYAAVRLVQTAFEWAAVSADRLPFAFTLLQVAENILIDPHKAATQLLAITAPDLGGR